MAQPALVDLQLQCASAHIFFSAALFAMENMAAVPTLHTRLIWNLLISSFTKNEITAMRELLSGRPSNSETTANCPHVSVQKFSSSSSKNNGPASLVWMVTTLKGTTLSKTNGKCVFHY